MTTKNEKTVSLVLGSGGARGLAHIGVIHWIEENGFKIESISGCSMGALIGGIYAAGKLDLFESWARAITKVAGYGLDRHTPDLTIARQQLEAPSGFEVDAMTSIEFIATDGVVLGDGFKVRDKVVLNIRLN